jgi:hypothetical protein
MNINKFALVVSGAVLALSPGLLAVPPFTKYDLNVAAFTLADDGAGHQIKLGGLSGLFPVPGDQSGTLFYAITDRGPNGDNPTNAAHKIFPARDFSPSILKIRLNPNNTADVLQITPLRKPNGSAVTGWPNSCFSTAEDGRDLSLNPLDDPDGLDTEGLTMDDQGNFWVSDEYRPSIAKVAPDGTVLFRLVPAGTVCGTEQIPTAGLLPAVYRTRRANRGMEGITYANGKVYGVMQRPLGNPTLSQANSGRHIRIIAIDTLTLEVQQYVYVTEANASQQNVHASDIFAHSPGVFLITERRTDKLFAVNFRPATDITPLENADGKLVADPTKTLEQLAPTDLAKFGIKPVKKAVVLDSVIVFDPALDKVEGLCVTRGQIVICPDNDFNLLGIDISTWPFQLQLMDPPNMPKIITTPLPEIVFSE